MNNKGVFMWLMAIGFICLVAALVVYLKSEDNGYSKLAKGVKEYNSQMDSMLADHQAISTDYQAMKAQLTANKDLLDKIKDRMQMLELRLDADSRKPHTTPISMPSKVTLKMEQPMQLLMPSTPIKVIYREAKPKKASKTPLLDKAGISKQKTARGH
jgi:uncharacterized protein YoxC